MSARRWPASRCRSPRRGQPVPAPCVLLSGGETTVTVRGHGRGGRNVEVPAGAGHSRCDRRARHPCALAGDTDGVDGQEEMPARMLTPDTLTRAWAIGLKPATRLDRQRRPRLLRGAGRLGGDRPDADQRQRLPGHPDRWPVQQETSSCIRPSNAKIVATLGPASSDRADHRGSRSSRRRRLPAELQPRHACRPPAAPRHDPRDRSRHRPADRHPARPAGAEAARRHLRRRPGGAGRRRAIPARPGSRPPGDADACAAAAPGDLRRTASPAPSCCSTTASCGCR